MGTPVVFLDPRSKGAEAYKAFAWEFMAKNPTRFDAVYKAPPAAPAPAPEEPADGSAEDASRQAAGMPQNS